MPPSTKLLCLVLAQLASGSSFPVGTTVNTWRAIDNNGLSSTCTFSVTITCGSTQPIPSEERTSGETASHDARDFSLTPNPTNEAVQITWMDGGAEPACVAVFDAQGRLAWTQTAKTGEQTLTLDVSSWTAGVYVVSLRSADKTVSKRLVVFN